jgi:hypothetical protein
MNIAIMEFLRQDGPDELNLTKLIKLLAYEKYNPVFPALAYLFY